MSEIVGIVHLDGAPVPPALADRLYRRGGPIGAAGVDLEVRGCVAFGRVLHPTTPEDDADRMPVYDRERDTLFTAAGRLDNRDELCNMLGVTSREQPNVADSTLMWRAYQRWGDLTPRHLFGDWGFAAWHARERRLVIARDQLGNTGLHYWCRPPVVVFGSSPDAVLAHPQISRAIDETRLARYLLNRFAPPHETFFRDVTLLPPGHQAALEERNLTVSRYWRCDDGPALSRRSHDDYLEGFLDHYRRAVTVRLRSTRPVASMLSSGLDSGSVTALAAEALGARGQRLVALTSVPATTEGLADVLGRPDEGPLARLVADRWPNIDHICCPASSASPTGAMEEWLDAFPQPVQGVTNLFWILDLCRQARANGAGVLLTGQLGNGGVSWSGGKNRLLALMLTAPLRQGVPALRAWKRRHRQSWLRTLAGSIVGPWLAPVRGPRGTERRLITDDFRRRTRRDVRLSVVEGWQALRWPLPPSLEHRLMFDLMAPTVGPSMQGLGASLGLDIRDPTADPRLIHYCFGLPNDLWCTDGGDRMVLRRAMNGLLPDAVAWNERRGRQASDIIPRLAARAGEVAATLDRLAASPVVCAHVDVPSLRRLWSETRVPDPVQARVSALGLLRGIMAGAFLSRQ